MPRSLIITADDFGLSPEVNAAVQQAHREGILTAASLMAAGSACEEAAAIARENPDLDVGLHLTVCRGSSVLRPERLSGLAAPDGRFPDNPLAAGLSYFFKRSLQGPLRDELRAQIDRHLQLIGRLDHIDGHLNFHVHPAVADALMELCAEYHVPCMRLPREPVFSTLALARDHTVRKLYESIIFRALSRRTGRLLAQRGIRTTSWLFGLHQSGHLTEDYVLGVIARLPEGLVEMYFHPAADIGGSPPDASNQRDLRILISPAVHTALIERSVTRTNFAAIARADFTSQA
ncbi:MAG: hopanoid biosynthesis-associated protein HpnK [Candidatus Binataceae bacterium]